MGLLAAIKGYDENCPRLENDWTPPAEHDCSGERYAGPPLALPSHGSISATSTLRPPSVYSRTVSGRGSTSLDQHLTHEPEPIRRLSWVGRLCFRASVVECPASLLLPGGICYGVTGVRLPYIASSDRVGVGRPANAGYHRA